MPFDPLDVIAECLGEPADSMRSPVNADYLCPHMDGKCSKTNHKNDLPFPVCSIYRKSAKRETRTPVCICPVRFYEASIAEDVLRECWTGPKPTRPRIAKEVKMGKFGNVDMVIAELDDAGTVVKNFIPVELQSVDITGSYMPAFEALTNSTMITGKFRYGFNWGNVRKRFLTQIIAKGFYCHGWGTRIVAVIQDDLFAKFDGYSKFTKVGLEDSDIVFMIYQFGKETPSGPWQLSLKEVFPTKHSLLMASILYETPPDKAKFERKILKNIIL
ncbi:MAG: NotI family restriction endonuclease [Gemmatimonas sp.]